MAGLLFPKVPGSTRLEAQRERRASKEMQRRLVYRVVDARDGTACRVCHAYCRPSSPAMETHADRHHVIPRSLGGPDESWNLIVLCMGCHDERHTRGTLQLSGNADERDGTGRLIGIKVERLTEEQGWQVEKFC